MVRSSPAGGEDVDVDGGWVAAVVDGAFSALFGDGAFYAAWADMGPAWRQRAGQDGTADFADEVDGGAGDDPAA